MQVALNNALDTALLYQQFNSLIKDIFVA